jgi:hypothetical protein
MPEEYKEKYKIYKEMDLTRGRRSHWINSAYEMGLRNVNSDRIGVAYDPNTDTVADTVVIAVEGRWSSKSATAKRNGATTDTVSIIDNISAIRAKKASYDELLSIYNGIDWQQDEGNEIDPKSNSSPVIVNRQRNGEDDSEKQGGDTPACRDVTDPIDDDKVKDRAKLPKLQVSFQSKADRLYQNDNDVSHPIFNPQRNGEDDSEKQGGDTPAFGDVIDLFDYDKDEDRAKLPKP